MTVVQADFRQIDELVQVADGLRQEEVKEGLGGKSSVGEGGQNSTLVLKRPVEGVLGR